MIKKLVKGKWHIYWKMQWFNEDHFYIFHTDSKERVGEMVHYKSSRELYDLPEITLFPIGLNLVDDDLKQAITEIIASI